MKNQLELTISSIKIQKFQKLFPVMESLNKGTIFKELDRPFLGEKRNNHE